MSAQPQPEIYNMAFNVKPPARNLFFVVFYLIALVQAIRGYDIVQVGFYVCVVAFLDYLQRLLVCVTNTALHQQVQEAFRENLGLGQVPPTPSEAGTTA